MKFSDIMAWIANNKGKFYLTLVGLVTAILMLTVGFFRTLLILLLTGLGGGYGYLIDKFGFADANKAIAEFIKRLFKRK